MLLINSSTKQVCLLYVQTVCSLVRMHSPARLSESSLVLFIFFRLTIFCHPLQFQAICLRFLFHWHEIKVLHQICDARCFMQCIRPWSAIEIRTHRTFGVRETAFLFCIHSPRSVLWKLIMVKIEFFALVASNANAAA